MNDSFEVKPCSRDMTDQDLWCTVCDRNIVKVSDESTGNFYAKFGTVRHVVTLDNGGWKSVLTDDYECFVWACCSSCLKSGTGSYPSNALN